MNCIHDKVQKARLELQQGKISIKLLSKLYQQYKHLDDIELFIERSISLFPNLNCGIASVYIQHVLGRGKVVKGKYYLNNHTFLLFEDQSIIDITADQYGGPTVYVGPIKLPWSLK